MYKAAALAIGLLSVPLATLAFAQETGAGKGTITTTGTATVDVVPDTVRIVLGHQVKLATLKQARAESDQQVKKITDAIKALKIESLQFTPNSSTIQAFLSSDPGGAAVPVPDMPLAPVGYQVTTTLTLTAKGADIEKLRDIARRVTDAALESGANVTPGSTTSRNELLLGGFGGIGGPGGARTVTRTVSPSVQFYKDNLDEIRSKALSTAVKNALAKADALAVGANTKIRKIMTIQDDTEQTGLLEPRELNDPYYGPFGNSRMDPTTATKNSLTVRVRVTCSLE